jgi:hypothetical protein
MNVYTIQLAISELAVLKVYETNQIRALLIALLLENPMPIVNFLNPIEEDIMD